MTRAMQNRKRGKPQGGPNRSAVSKEKTVVLSPASTALYVRLRLALDSFNAMSMKYYSSAPDIATKERRVREIERRATELQRRVIKELFDMDTGCPPGMKDCGGRCIPMDHDCLL